LLVGYDYISLNTFPRTVCLSAVWNDSLNQRLFLDLMKLHKM